MRGDFDRRIARALQLAVKHPESATLLDFYRQLAALQKGIFTHFRSKEETSLLALKDYFPALVALVQSSGPAPLADFSRQPLNSEELLTADWEGRPETPEGRFFARALLQPYAEYLAGRGNPAPDQGGSTCPFCAAKPVAGILRGEGDGAKRSLLCSRCATEWIYRRILCPNCGEEQKDNLPVFLAEEINYVRVEACDSCRTYIKSVDLTKNGLAVPEVDELATVTLNLWAEEQGYVKLESNLLGM